jgi:predicted transcriptional regulator
MSGKNEKILQAFLGGKARARIVKLFLHHPSLSINVEGVAKRVGIKNKECNGVIKELSNFGFISVIKQANVSRRKKLRKSRSIRIIKK